MTDIVIVGGGIGGLATALAVAAAGMRATVLERNETFGELGAGIQLAPNGMAALDRLGLGPAVRRQAVAVDDLRFYDGVTGEHVTSVPLTGDYRRRFANPYVVVHRGELHRLLLDACRATAGIELRAGTTVTGYDQAAGKAYALLAGGARVAGDALVGADGIRSAIRRQLVGDGEPRVSGITVYRSIVPVEVVPPELRWNAVTWWAGPGCHFVHYPIAGGRYVNLAASCADGVTEAFSGRPETQETVRRELAPLAAATPRKLLGLGPDWRSWVLVDRPPVPEWTDGRVTLLGDAAHPMLHYAAQGACTALEDAVTLGQLLAAYGVDRALADYPPARRERTAAIQRVSRDSVRLWHPAGAAAAERNAALAAMSPTDLHDQLAWLHDAGELRRPAYAYQAVA